MKRYLILFVVLFSLMCHAQKSDFKHINFAKADSIAKSYQGSNLKNLTILSHFLTRNLDTQVEQFRAIHTWVCLNVESDHSFGETTLRKRNKFKNDSISFIEWNNKVLAKFYKKLLEEKKTICTGYAFLIKELATLADIECKIVNGYSRTVTRNVGNIDIPNHSWNAVKLNDKWYVVDATMSSGFFNITKNTFIKDYNDGYFLASPELFIKKNYPLDSVFKFSENIKSLNQFVNAPIVYGNAFKHGVNPIIPETLVTKVEQNKAFVFKFKVLDGTVLGGMYLVYSSNFKSGSIKISTSDYNKGILEFKHSFKKKGRYDMHLMVKTDVVISFTIQVEKSKL